ncbi:hypothetical protein [Streptomyces sp. NPDC046976]|uniref:hypothetical protein n=1 Tax=Streptomyces sp. NPDC046976 TaxID=3155258 RepID=UPI0033EDEB27
MPLVERGEAPAGILAVPAPEQWWVISADRAAGHLTAFAEACGITAERARDHVPRAGCRACPAYVALRVLNASPADVIVALTANFST